jgi:hypothetical protein
MEGGADILVQHVRINCINIFVRSLDCIEFLQQEVFIPPEHYCFFALPLLFPALQHLISEEQLTTISGLRHRY